MSEKQKLHDLYTPEMIAAMSPDDRADLREDMVLEAEFDMARDSRMHKGTGGAALTETVESMVERKKLHDLYTPEMIAAMSPDDRADLREDMVLEAEFDMARGRKG